MASPRFGNRGMNQPVVDLRTQRCYITSQNHGFAVDQRTLPERGLANGVKIFDSGKISILLEDLLDDATGPAGTSLAARDIIGF